VFRRPYATDPVEMTEGLYGLKHGGGCRGERGLNYRRGHARAAERKNGKGTETAVMDGDDDDNNVRVIMIIATAQYDFGESGECGR